MSKYRIVEIYQHRTTWYVAEKCTPVEGVSYRGEPIIVDEHWNEVEGTKSPEPDKTEDLLWETLHRKVVKELEL